MNNQEYLAQFASTYTDQLIIRAQHGDKEAEAILKSFGWIQPKDDE